jgi:hypothetical protein
MGNIFKCNFFGYLAKAMEKATLADIDLGRHMRY